MTNPSQESSHSANIEVSHHASLNPHHQHSPPEKSRIVRTKVRKQSQPASNQSKVWLRVYDSVLALSVDDDLVLEL
jgi:hypothetical protein